MKHQTILAAVVLPLLAVPAVARADEAAASTEASSGPLTISGEIGVFSDYRFRGLSLSGKFPELTASLSVNHESGLYASAWLSNVELGSGDADNLEMDWTAGYAKDVGALSLDGGVIYYSYLQHHEYNYIELYGSVGTKVGPADVKVGVNYAPKQSHIGDRTNTYVYVSGEVPVTGPLSAHGTFGFENGAFGDHKKDWNVGLSYDAGNGLTLGADYIDTAHSLTSLGDPTVVASVKWGF